MDQSDPVVDRDAGSEDGKTVRKRPVRSIVGKTVLKKPAAAQYLTMFYRNDTFAAIRCAFGGRRQVIQFKKAYWSQARLRELADEGAKLLNEGQKTSIHNKLSTTM